MAEYIERERIEKFFDGIYDCADLTSEPNDHCCSADDCGHCKWYEAKNAIQKCILSIPASDVCPVVRGRWIEHRFTESMFGFECSVCHTTWDTLTDFCPFCGSDMRR